MIRYLLILLFLLPLPAAAAAPLVADLSNYRIDIDSSFNGTRIFLFGVRNDNGDIVAVIRGPRKDYIVRKKEKIAGMWINRERMKFLGVPDFYATAAGKPLDAIEQAAISHQLSIGESNVLLPPTDPKQLAIYSPFAEAFLRHQRESGLYVQSAGQMQFMGETLFKTVIEFPDNIPPGDYTAEIYLLSDGEVVGMQSTPIKVVKSGMDAFLYTYAHQYPLLYGLTAVFLALGIGWGTGRIFENMR